MQIFQTSLLMTTAGFSLNIVICCLSKHLQRVPHSFLARTTICTVQGKPTAHSQPVGFSYFPLNTHNITTKYFAGT